MVLVFCSDSRVHHRMYRAMLLRDYDLDVLGALPKLRKPRDFNNQIVLRFSW